MEKPLLWAAEKIAARPCRAPVTAEDSQEELKIIQPGCSSLREVGDGGGRSSLKEESSWGSVSSASDGNFPLEKKGGMRMEN